MPELPEVETVRRQLLTLVRDETIVRVDAPFPTIITHDLRWFQATIANQVIRHLDRKGKFLVFMLDRHAMIIHLRMEGKFHIKTDEPILKHEHAIFHFASGRNLRYHDVRKFGRITLVEKDDVMRHPGIAALAAEPKDLDVKAFYQRLKKKRVAVKTALLDQRLIAGLGNIYVDETLFRSGIHPKRLTSSLTKKQVEQLVENATIILTRAVELGGATIRSYQAITGVHGRFQNELAVHTKKDEPCPVCQTSIIKIKVGGRGTYVCPQCQQ